MPLKALPNDNILDWSKLKICADDKVNLIKKLKYVLGWSRKNCGKRENADNQHFFFSYNVFKRLHSQGKAG